MYKHTAIHVHVYIYVIRSNIQLPPQFTEASAAYMNVASFMLRDKYTSCIAIKLDCLLTYLGSLAAGQHFKFHIGYQYRTKVTGFWKINMNHTCDLACSSI